MWTVTMLVQLKEDEKKEGKEKKEMKKKKNRKMIEVWTRE